MRRKVRPTSVCSCQTKSVASDHTALSISAWFPGCPFSFSFLPSYPTTSLNKCTPTPISICSNSIHPSRNSRRDASFYSTPLQHCNCYSTQTLKLGITDLCMYFNSPTCVWRCKAPGVCPCILSI